MELLLRPLRWFGYWFLAMGIGAAFIHHSLAGTPGYTPLFEFILLGVSVINILMGMLFIFPRRIAGILFSLFMMALARRLGGQWVDAARRFSERLNISAN